MPREMLDKLWQRGREFLGVQYPILGGAMSWISESKLVSAISNAGGFGVLAGGNMPQQMFKDEMAKTREKTDKPFGVNLITIAPNFRRHLDHVMEIRFPTVIFAGGLPPREAIRDAKAEGIKVFCFAPTVGIAHRLIKENVDALIIEGSEAGGHIGPVSTAVLAEEILPHTRKVPVFVAGGVGSGVMMVHYLLMGAAGVQIGTKFAVSEESIAHPNFKQAMIKARAKDAVPTSAFDPRIPVIPVRALINEGTMDFNTLQLGLIAQLERGQISAKDATHRLEEFWIGGLRKAAIEGDVERGSMMAGQSVGMVKEVMPVPKIIETLIDEAVLEAEHILARLGRK
jgi:enoyl-[acyl-carrier protein] reductase II